MLKSKVLNIIFLLKSKVLNIAFLLKSKVLNIIFLLKSKVLNVTEVSQVVFTFALFGDRRFPRFLTQ